MRALALVWICVSVVGCTAQRGQRPSGTPSNRAGRMQTVYQLDLDQAVKDRASEWRAGLEAQLADAKLAATVTVEPTPAGAITVTPSHGSQRAELQELVTASSGDEIVARTCEASAGPDAICVQLAASFAASIKQAALSSAVATIRARLATRNAGDATVVARGEHIVVELPATDRDAMHAIRSLIARPGLLELKVVDHGADYMKRLFAHVGMGVKDGAPTDPAALAAGIKADLDQWQPEAGGGVQTDFYLTASDREDAMPIAEAKQLGCATPDARQLDGKVRCLLTGRHVLTRYLEDLVRQDPSFQLPPDRQLGFEAIEPVGKGARTIWRTYYLEQAAPLTGASVSDASVMLDPNTNHPIVLLDFGRAGARVLADLTAKIAGKKLAIVFDGRVRSAPIITGPIAGGRASISMGGNDPAAQERDATELVLVLRTGSLPAPLREISATVVP